MEKVRTCVPCADYESLRVGDAGLCEIYAITGKAEKKFARRFEVVAIGQEEKLPTIILRDEFGKEYKKIACWFSFVSKERR